MNVKNVMIIFQTLSSMGFGVNFMLSYFMYKIPNGGQMVADMMNVPNPPLMQTSLMTVICAMGMIVITLYNLGITTEGKDEENGKN